MARLLWLADCLRGAGLVVHEVDDWHTRGADSYGPVYGVTIHETRGSASSTNAGEISVLLNGSNTAPPPIAQLYLSRSGEWWVVASGTCFHNKIGWGGPNKNLGNDSLLGIEAQHAASEDWANKPAQYASYVRGVAALIARGGWPVSRVAGHKEHQPGDKPDPEFDMAQFRRDVAAAMASAPAGGDGDMSDAYNLLDGLNRVQGNNTFTPAGPDGARYGSLSNAAAIASIQRAEKDARLAADGVAELKAAAAEERTRDAATAAALKAIADVITAGGGSIEIAPILARIDARAAEVRADVEQVHRAQLAERDARLAALQAELAKLTAPQS